MESDLVTKYRKHGLETFEFLCGHSVFVQVVPINSCPYKEWVFSLIGSTRRDRYAFTIVSYRGSHYIRDVNRFWSSRRKLKSSRQIDADGSLSWRASSVPFMAGSLGSAQGSQKLWDKWCKILHSRPLLALNFIIETSFFCTIFLIFLFTFFLHFSNCLHHCLFFAFWKSHPVNLVYIFVCSVSP